MVCKVAGIAFLLLDLLTGVVNFIMGYFSALSMVIILLGLLSGTMVLHKPNFEPPDFAAPELYPATPQNEADEKAGFNLGRPLGAKRSLDGLPFPSDEFLDSIIKTTIPNKSEAFKQGFKAGYFDGWQSRDGKPI